MSKPLKPLTSSQSTGSLAELLIADAIRDQKTVKLWQSFHTTDPEKRQHELHYENLARIKSGVADHLPKIKRLSYDRSIVRLAELTTSLGTEEVIGQLSHVSFPFDQFWIEGPSCYNGPSLKGLRIGAFITANQQKNEFTFIHYQEIQNASYVEQQKGWIRQSFIATDNKWAHTPGIYVRVSMDGITLDEDKLLKNAEMAQGLMMDTQGNHIRADASSILDEPYDIADFLVRTLVVLSSPNVPNNFQTPKTREELDLEAKNRRRKDMGFAPILTVSPIKVDLAQINPRFLETEKPTEVRQLFGWTSVRRSKEVRRPDGTLWLRKKDGMPWTRKPHDRKIAAPVDRRNAEREIFSSDPNLTVTIDDGRPIKVRHDGLPADKPAPGK